MENNPWNLLRVKNTLYLYFNDKLNSSLAIEYIQRNWGVSGSPKMRLGGINFSRGSEPQQVRLWKAQGFQNSDTQITFDIMEFVKWMAKSGVISYRDSVTYAKVEWLVEGEASI